MMKTKCIAVIASVLFGVFSCTDMSLNPFAAEANDELRGTGLSADLSPSAKLIPGGVNLGIILKAAAGSGKTEIHTLFGRDFKTFAHSSATAMYLTGDNNEFVYLFGNFNNDGSPDCYIVQKTGGSGKTELHILDGKKGYRDWADIHEYRVPHVATVVGPTGGEKWVYLLGDYNSDGVTDLYIIERNRSAKLYVHVINGADNFQSYLLSTATEMYGVPLDNSFQFALANFESTQPKARPDLYILQKNGGSGKTEVHILSGSKNYTQWSPIVAGRVSHTATIFPVCGNGKEVDFLVDDYNGDSVPDLYMIQREATGSGMTEVHIADGGANFQRYLTHAATAMWLPGNNNRVAFCLMRGSPGVQRFVRTVPTGTTLGKGASLVSENGQFRLDIQNDGNVVIYDGVIDHHIWNTQTAGKNISSLVVQNDGNLVLYDANGAALWKSDTHGKGPVKMVLEDNGELRLYSTVSGAAVWLSFSGYACFAVGTRVVTDSGQVPIESLRNGQKLLSIDTIRDGSVLSKQIHGVRKFRLPSGIQVTTERILQDSPGRKHQYVSSPWQLYCVHEGNDLYWVPAALLSPGAALVSRNGIAEIVVKVEILQQATEIVGFEVADNRNFFIGDDGIIVHNSVWDSIDWGRAIEYADVGKDVGKAAGAVIGAGAGVLGYGDITANAKAGMKAGALTGAIVGGVYSVSLDVYGHYFGDKNISVSPDITDMIDKSIAQDKAAMNSGANGTAGGGPDFSGIGPNIGADLGTELPGIDFSGLW